LLEKLASRRPRRRDLVQALLTTLKHSGGLNKRRAALYLGWDPDTLVARMKEAHIDGEELVPASGWSGELAASVAPDPPA
jgi:DNA-binding NtrC family response regulator